VINVVHGQAIPPDVVAYQNLLDLETTLIDSYSDFQATITLLQAAIYESALILDPGAGRTTIDRI
jgi:hypothetical protein